MNILVFGKDGQLGRAFKNFFDASQVARKFRVNYVGRAECDVSDGCALKKLLDNTKPQLIINASAYTAVDKAEAEIDLAYKNNAKAPALMAHYAATHGATLLHYSTDYVFDGGKEGFYVESDLPKPLNIYGESKAEGELLIEQAFNGAISGQYVVFRTSWLYGDGKNFIKKILHLGCEQDCLSVVSDQFGVPTSADWLAAISLDFVMDHLGSLKEIDSGIYHATPRGETNWCALASYALKIAKGAGAILKTSEEDIKPILTVEYPAIARRPMNSKMSSTKLKQAFLKQGDVSKLQYWEQSWADQVKAYVEGLICKNYLKGD